MASYIAMSRIDGHEVTDVRDGYATAEFLALVRGATVLDTVRLQTANGGAVVALLVATAFNGNVRRFALYYDRTLATMVAMPLRVTP